MYDWPEVHWAHDALWAAIRDRLRAGGMDAPELLERGRPSEEIWLDPNLILSQTCGWPYSTRLRDKVRLVGTPSYAVEGCDGPLYSSAIVARREDARLGLVEFARRRIAFNASDSLSGFVALRAALCGEGLDPDAAEWVETGSHRSSVLAVANGKADLAAIDAVCWALARDHEGESAGRLAVIAWTPLRPGLPLITSLSYGKRNLAVIRSAVREAMESPATADARVALHLTSCAVLDESDYVPIAALRQPRIAP